MKKKFIVLICCMGLLAGIISGCGSSTSRADADSNTLIVGCTAKPHSEILEVVKPVLAEDGVDMTIKVFTDYVLINPALQDGEVDANFFQHTPFLDDFNQKNGTELSEVVKVHNEPMGIYSKKMANLSELKDGDSVGIPNDATNGGRALLVLQDADLIKLRDGVGVTGLPDDVVENPLNLNIIMMDAPMLPKTLDDKTVALCVINSNYALEAGLNPVEDAIFMEAKDSPFANILVTKPESINNESIQKLAKALQSPEVKQFLEEKYPGACVPAF